MNRLPTELIDKIILYTNINTAIIVKNNYAIGKLYDKKIHTLIWSIKNNHLEFLKWMSNKGDFNTIYSLRTTGWSYALEYNNLIIIKWLHYNEFISEDILIFATYDGDLEIIKWLYNKGYKFTNQVMRLAEERSNIKIIKFWFINGGKITEYGMNCAAINDKLDIMKWYYNEGIDITDLSIQYVIERANMSILMWIHSTGYKFTNDHILYAKKVISSPHWMVIPGHQEVLEFLQN